MSVNDMTEEEFDEYYNRLVELVEPLREYYNIDKVKTYGVYVWDKDDDVENQCNVFDIYAHEIVMYDKEHIIISEAMPIIKCIQEHLAWFDKYLEENLNEGNND